MSLADHFPLAERLTNRSLESLRAAGYEVHDFEPPDLACLDIRRVVRELQRVYCRLHAAARAEMELRELRVAYEHQAEQLAAARARLAGLGTPQQMYRQIIDLTQQLKVARSRESALLITENIRLRERLATCEEQIESQAGIIRRLCADASHFPTGDVPVYTLAACGCGPA